MTENIPRDEKIIKAMEAAEERARFRECEGPIGTLTKVVLVLIPIVAMFFALGIPTYLRIPLFPQQEVGAFLALLLAGVFLLVPAHAKAPRQALPWYDAVLAALGFAGGINLALFFSFISQQMGNLSSLNMSLAVVTALLVLEATRRMLGWPLVVIGLVFIMYARLSGLFYGMLGTPGYNFGRIFESLYSYPEGILGTPLTVAATIVVVYILFGNSLLVTGATEVVNGLALALVGHMRGGPAKIAVIGSGLFGTISGSPASDVVTTGTITIPLMKRSGYPPHFAAAVEAVASTGGAIMPPVMAAVGFLIAEYLGIPYGEVALAAALPAILYYFCTFLQVDLRAAKEGLKGLPRNQLPPLKKTLVNCYLVIVPIAILITLLMGLHFPPQTAGLFAVVSVLVVSLFKQETRTNWKNISIMLENTGRSLLQVGVVSAVAGIIVGILMLTGLGVNLSMFLEKLAGGNVAILLVLTAITSIILGMGMPATPAYLVLAVLVAPALIRMGIMPLAAHLFIFYWGILSFLTPPIAIAAYVAAGIANCDPIRVAWQSVRLGIIAFVVPFIFVYQPALLFQGSIGEISLAIVTALAGTSFLAMALEGFFIRSLKWWQRIMLALAGLSLLIPGLGTDFLGLILGCVVLLIELRQRRSNLICSKQEAKVVRH